MRNILDMIVTPFTLLRGIQHIDKTKFVRNLATHYPASLNSKALICEYLEIEMFFVNLLQSGNSK